MLGKLIKHEFRATATPMLLLLFGMLLVSGLTRLCMLFAEAHDFFAILTVIAVILCYVLFMAAYVFIYVLIIYRFYKHIYGVQGYLTLTLPVSRSKLIFSKLIVAMVWQLLGTIAIIGSFFIIMAQPGIFDVMGVVLGYIVEFLNMPPALLVIELIAFSVIGMIEGVLVMYASISIGQLFKKHRVLGSVLGYFAIYIAVQIIMTVYTMIMSTVSLFGGYNYNAGGTLDGLAVFQNQVFIILYLAILVLITAGCWMVTHGVMKKAVNLQ